MATLKESKTPPSSVPFEASLERLFQDWNFAPFSIRPRIDGFIPSLDIFEEKEAFVVKAELPGLTEKDVEIDLDGRLLTLRGKKKWEAEKQGGAYRCIERRFGAFRRQIALPASVDTGRPAAELRNGVLTIRFPKRSGAVKKVVRIETK